MARQPYMGLGLLVSSRFHGHTHLRHTTVGRTHLDEEPARRRDLYLTTHNTHKRQTSMPPVGFFFVLIPGFSPLSHLYCWSPFFCPACHFTVHATVHTSNTTQTSMPPVGFEPTILVSERPRTHALDRTATEIGGFEPTILVSERPKTYALDRTATGIIPPT
jgi:hypothetical protein